MARPKKQVITDETSTLHGNDISSLDAAIATQEQVEQIKKENKSKKPRKNKIEKSTVEKKKRGPKPKAKITPSTIVDGVISCQSMKRSVMYNEQFIKVTLNHLTDSKDPKKSHSIHVSINVKDDHHFLDMITAITNSWYQENHKNS